MLMASMAEESSVRYPLMDISEMQKELLRFFEEAGRTCARDDVIKEDTKIEDYNAEEMNIIANKKIVQRRRERFTRHLRRRRKKKKSKSSQDEESLMSESDEEEMKTAQEEVKRLMEKSIRDNITSTINNTNDGDDAKMVDFKAGEMNIMAEDEEMFPRPRGRFIRYLRRQRSKSQDSAFEIEFHHLLLPMTEETFIGYSSEEMNEEIIQAAGSDNRVTND